MVILVIFHSYVKLPEGRYHWELWDHGISYIYIYIYHMIILYIPRAFPLLNIVYRRFPWPCLVTPGIPQKISPRNSSEHQQITRSAAAGNLTVFKKISLIGHTIYIYIFIHTTYTYIYICVYIYNIYIYIIRIIYMNVSIYILMMCIYIYIYSYYIHMWFNVHDGICVRIQKLAARWCWDRYRKGRKSCFLKA